MAFVADFHIHSKYSRATSPDMDLEHVAESAKRKGLALLGSGDFTHPKWLAELKAKLTPLGNGLYEYGGVTWILTSEVNNIYSKSGKGRRVHNILFAPSLEVVEDINKQLSRYGALDVDGRPILSFPCSRMAELLRKISPEIYIIPGHAWTPHYSVFGANSGFDTLEECFEDETPHIFAIETGLSSDPPMNWRLSRLDKVALISNSDAHSPAKLGREANVFDCEPSYAAILEAVRTKDRSKFLMTYEFFPEEGKYHYDGHRDCGTVLPPQEAIRGGNLCPSCGKKLTIGVAHRVEELADRPEDYHPDKPIPFKHLVPLDEIVSAALGVGTGSETVARQYEALIKDFKNEFEILLKTSKEEIASCAGAKVAEAVVRVRKGQVKVDPGYDGVYGKIRLFDQVEKAEESQLGLF
jgi:uncharacterized protein (TIGR00375 family)